MHDTAKLTITILKSILERDGLDASLRAARDMIIAAAAILGHERGPLEVGEVFDLACEAQWPRLELVS